MVPVRKDFGKTAFAGGFVFMSKFSKTQVLRGIIGFVFTVFFVCSPLFDWGGLVSVRKDREPFSPINHQLSSINLFPV